VRVCRLQTEQVTRDVSYTVCVPKTETRTREVTSYRCVPREKTITCTVMVPTTVEKVIKVPVCHGPLAYRHGGGWFGHLARNDD